MADDTTTIRKKYTHPYDDPLNPDPHLNANQFRKNERRLWQALYENTVTQQGGWVVSNSVFEKSRNRGFHPDRHCRAKLLEFGYTRPRCRHRHTTVARDYT